MVTVVTECIIYAATVEYITRDKLQLPTTDITKPDVMYKDVGMTEIKKTWPCMYDTAG